MMQPDRSCRRGCSISCPCARPDYPPQRPSCPPRECQCFECCRTQHACPCHQLPPHGFLLPRIIAAGRQWQRRHSLCLTLDDLPDCAEAPFTLISVMACGPCSWESVPVDSGHVVCLKVHIPLACQVRDRCGEIYIGHSSLSTEVSLRLSCPAAECWRHQMMLFPCVRLACAPCTADTPCFDIHLEILAEAYLTRWEPCMADAPKPVCPDLPLYPPVCYD